MAATDDVGPLPRTSWNPGAGGATLPSMQTITAKIIAPQRSLLRAALTLDAGVTAANGAAYLALAGPLHDLLGLSEGLLRGAGAFLLVYAAAVALLAARPAPARGPVLAVVSGNVAWALGSVVAAGAGLGDPTTAGAVWMVLQALVVAGFAAIGLAGLARREG